MKRSIIIGLIVALTVLINVSVFSCLPDENPVHCNNNDPGPCNTRCCSDGNGGGSSGGGSSTAPGMPAPPSTDGNGGSSGGSGEQECGCPSSGSGGGSGSGEKAPKAKKAFIVKVSFAGDRPDCFRYRCLSFSYIVV